MGQTLGFKYAFFFVFAFYFVGGVAQSSNHDSIYLDVDTLPRSIKGDSTWNNFVMHNIKYPEKLKAEGFKGTIVISFLVNRDSSVSQIFCYTGCDLDPMLFKQVISLVKLSDKQWIPAQAHGKPVRYRMKVPIKLNVKGDPTIYQKVDKKPLLTGKYSEEISFVETVPELEPDTLTKFNISFVVNTDGTVSDLSFDSAYHQFQRELDKAILMIIVTKWQAAELNHRKVRYRMMAQMPFKRKVDVFTFAQIKSYLKAAETDSVYEKVDSIAEFIGDSTLSDFIIKNLHYPDGFNSKVKAEYIISFIVNKDGSISEVKCVGPDCNFEPAFRNEALRVVWQTDQQWIPAILNHQYVRSICHLPIIFEIEEVE